MRVLTLIQTTFVLFLAAYLSAHRGEGLFRMGMTEHDGSVLTA
jgi:hypothetical protein